MQFDWQLVGKTGDVANPPWFTITLYNKVNGNTVGAAEKSALTDDKTVVLWDKLLDSLKFRVQVPSAPAGSYYIEADTVEKQLRESSTVCNPGDVCPKTGF